MKTSNFLKAGALILGAVVLSAFAVLTSNDSQTEELSAQASTSTELLALNTIDFDGKCGEGKCGEGKKSEKKEGAKEEKKEGKCGEGKCGEGKKSEKKSEKKKEKKESKCGEGKCGGQ
jgi:uncharacterized low-complexity protein